MSSSIEVRAFGPDDYGTLAALRNGCLEGVMCPHDAVEIRDRDKRHPDHLQFHRFIAWVDGRPVGFAELFEPWFFYAPGRWFVDVGVPMAHRGRGYGRALAAHLRSMLTQRAVTILFGATLEGAPGQRFAARFGFEAKVREPLSQLDLGAFDFERYAGLRESMPGKGVRISSGAEVLATVPDAVERWWDLAWAIQQDIPFNRPSERMSLEVFRRLFVASHFDGALWHIARAGDDFVGVSGLKPTADPERVLTTVTGVVRSHRRQGVATALKLSSLQVARARGIKRVDTDNEEDNPMLAINQRLGFREVGVWLCLERPGAVTP